MRRLFPFVILWSLLSGCGCGPYEDVDFAAYIVGSHLGNYTACPGEGYMPGQNESEPMTEEDEGCEPGQLTLVIENNTETDWENVQILSLALLNKDGEIVGNPPIYGIFRVPENEPFDGRIPAHTVMTLRIDFQGPADLSEIYGDDSANYTGVPCEITIDNGQEMLVIDPTTAPPFSGAAT